MGKNAVPLAGNPSTVLRDTWSAEVSVSLGWVGLGAECTSAAMLPPPPSATSFTKLAAGYQPASDCKIMASPACHSVVAVGHKAGCTADESPRLEPLVYFEGGMRTPCELLGEN